MKTTFLIGYMGSGKTTLLRCLNFLERPDRGVIRVGGNILFDSADPSTWQESAVRKKRLHFGLVFQSFNLFANMSALKNCMIGVEKVKKQSRQDRMEGNYE